MRKGITESFNSSSPVANVNGDSQTWKNKLDVDMPVGWKLFGRELHTGGFFARTELFGGIAQGLNDDHLYTFNGRVVMDLLGIWKLLLGRTGSVLFSCRPFQWVVSGFGFAFPVLNNERTRQPHSETMNFDKTTKTSTVAKFQPARCVRRGFFLFLLTMLFTLSETGEEESLSLITHPHSMTPRGAKGRRVSSP